MTPDRTHRPESPTRNLSRADTLRLRKEDAEQRRESPTGHRPESPAGHRPESPTGKRAPKNTSKPQRPESPKGPSLVSRLSPTVSRTHSPKATAIPATKTSRHRYDIAMSAPRAHSSSFRATKPPRVAISLPRLQFGPRWFSFLIVLFCLVDLYLMLNMDPFIVRRATILGNERLSLQEIENVLGANNLAATVLNPAQIEYNILASFPEVATAQAQVNLPAELQITIKERTPVASWTQDNQTVWIDSQGFAFAPRGEAPNLITISATGAPPQPSSPDSAPGIGAHAFMTTQLMSAITTLAPSLPDGASLVFDPQYGLGWIEPGGCKVYFGNTYLDTPLKLQVVQAILKHLAEQELKPALISVAYPNAPFYRLATP